MNNPLSLSPLIPALIGAGAYCQDGQDGQDARDRGRRAQLPPQALADVRRARVELYCDHEAQALLCIRAALSLLSHSPEPVSPELMAALTQAAWLARHGRYVAAEAALDAALAGMELPTSNTH